MKTEIAQRLRELGAESVEERRLAEKKARQEEALDYYRKHGTVPSTENPAGWSWYVWTGKGRKRDPEFVKRARALGWMPERERTAVVKEAALNYYKKHGEPPPKRDLLGSVWTRSIAKGTQHDPLFYGSAIALGWRPLEERMSDLKEEALAYYRKCGKIPPKSDSLGRAWMHWTSQGGVYDPDFVSRARAIGWRSRAELTADRKEEALEFYRKHGEPPERRTPLGGMWSSWVSKGGNHDPDFVKQVRALGWRPLYERVIAMKKEALDYYRAHGRPPAHATSLGVAWSGWNNKGSSIYDPDFIKSARSLGWRPRSEVLGWLPQVERTAALKEEALDFYRKHGETPGETPLGRSWNMWTAKGERHDSDFVKRARALGWLPQRERTGALKEEALDYYRKHGRSPNTKTSLGVAWAGWVCETSKTYDPDFVKRARALGWRTRSERSK